MLSGFSPHAMNQLQDALGGGSAVTVVIDFERLAAEVAELRLVAERIADSVANPTWAAGDELCRRAATALQHEWYEDADRDASASIAAYPYRAAPHLLRGLALLHFGDAVEALSAFEAAIRYGKAAEPDHAATAGLLAANLIAATGNLERLRAVLATAEVATAGRCPQLLMAAYQQGIAPHADRAHKLLVDDPGAWIDTDAPMSLFGPGARVLEDAYEALVHEARDSVARASRFHRAVSDIPREHFSFYGSMFTPGGNQLYSGGGHSGGQQYLDGGALRLLGPFLDALGALAEAPIAQRIAAGHTLVRHLGFRVPSHERVTQEIYLDFNIDQSDLADTRPLRPTETAWDVVVGDWAETERIMYDDLPRGAGRAQGTGLYLRALRARWQHDRDFDDIDRAVRNAELVPAPRGFRPKWWDVARYREAQEVLPSLRRILATAPPEVGDLHKALMNWIAKTQPTGEPVIRPIKTVSSPPALAA